MKITAIKQQTKRAGRYSIYVDQDYAFSLSAAALLDSKLITGQELNLQQVRDFKKLSDDDKLYNLTLGFLAIRARSKWEIQCYLNRKKASPPLIAAILNKLSKANLLDDQAFAESFVRDRRLLRPTSRRKMIMELKQKRISEEVIQKVLGSELDEEQTALQAVIERKRRQSKYQDNQKLMKYLAGQGFGYGDIKTALQKGDD